MAHIHKKDEKDNAIKGKFIPVAQPNNIIV